MPKIFCAFCGYNGPFRKFCRVVYKELTNKDFLCEKCDTSNDG